MFYRTQTQRNAQKLAHYSISDSSFCKDPRKFACFQTFRGKWDCLIMNTNPKFYTIVD